MSIINNIKLSVLCHCNLKIIRMFNYIDPSGQKQYKNFKYQTSDSGITYQYLWSPFGDWLIQFFPKNIAPNTITLSAFILLALSHIAFVMGCNGTKIATWRLILMAVSIIVYQHLDNLDGKQARRTKSATPLGMLFDHGADSVSTFFISIQMLQIFQLTSGTQKILSITAVVMMVYFAAMWAQYSSGVFKLGIVNPVDQGLPAFALTAILGIFIPWQFWNTEHWFGRYNQELMTCLYSAMPGVIYNMTKGCYKNPIRPVEQCNKLLLLPLSYAITIALLYYFDSNIFNTITWPLYYCLMFSWARNMILIQLSFVTKQVYNPFNAGTLGFIIPSLLFLLVNTKANTYFWMVAIIQGIIFLEFVVSVIKQSAKILNIRVFSIEKVSTD